MTTNNIIDKVKKRNKVTIGRLKKEELSVLDDYLVSNREVQAQLGDLVKDKEQRAVMRTLLKILEMQIIEARKFKIGIFKK